MGAFDRWQQRNRPVGFVLATLQKYSDDQGAYLAATISYYAFFSLFPLLLVLATVLGFVLSGHAHLERSLVDSALGQFPVIGRQLRAHSLRGSGLALAIGIAAALWAGMGVVRAAQNAMDQLWGVPVRQRPGFLPSRLRALLLLGVLGGGLLLTTVLSGLGSFGASYGIGWKVGSIALATVLNFLLFWVGFRLLTTRDVTWRQLRGGAFAAAVSYEALQAVGGYYVGHVVKGASETYGTFALVIGLLSWVFLSAHAILLAAEGNVVATRRLWPRSLSVAGEQSATSADEAALTVRTKAEQQRSDERIRVDFDRERA
ncbi:MAG TPA: YihY/virulence factor BrkB family protein [Gaiellaceae bacterium]|nr:YihY/virulence factor BrkB family protein [Gaiellaceae bacterium]